MEFKLQFQFRNCAYYRIWIENRLFSGNFTKLNMMYSRELESCNFGWLKILFWHFKLVKRQISLTFVKNRHLFIGQWQIGFEIGLKKGFMSCGVAVKICITRLYADITRIITRVNHDKDSWTWFFKILEDFKKGRLSNKNEIFIRF